MEEAYYKIFPQMESSLGPHVRVVPIRPVVWIDNGAQSPEHDFNVMYLVEFAGRRILFTGDVSPQLFTQIMNIPRYKREIAAVDFLVLPHHGTNRAGELLTFWTGKPEMCIVCSNPHEKEDLNATRRDFLPWKEVGNLPFKKEQGVIVKKHSISTARKTQETNLPIKIETQETDLPIFVTYDADEQKYYELVIEADGRATLFDGSEAKGRGDFCFQSL
jgi:hypothetical protein